MSKSVYVGVIPDIFGYGINVVSDSRKGAMDALRNAYDEWKAARPDRTTNFKSSFEYWGGYVVEVELGKGYYDGFNS
jgi:hypothetical protein